MLVILSKNRQYFILYGSYILITFDYGNWSAHGLAKLTGYDAPVVIIVIYDIVTTMLQPCDKLVFDILPTLS